MKKGIVIGLCIVALVLVSSNVFAGSGYFYRDSNYKGKKLTVKQGTEKSSLGSWNDKISSYKIDSGVQCVITKDSKFGGSYKYITGSASSMPSGWNDKVSSITCMQNGYFTNYTAPAAVCYVYEHNHFAGRRLVIRVDQNKPNLKNNGMNDKISSIRVGWGIKCDFYKDSNYRHKLFSMTGNRHKNDLINEYNDKISSIRSYTYQP